MNKIQTAISILLTLVMLAAVSLVATAADGVTGPENTVVAGQATVEDSAPQDSASQAQDAAGGVTANRQRPNPSSFSKTYGGPTQRYGYSVIQTSDGGYLEAGYAGTPNEGTNPLLVKTDQYGNKQWEVSNGRSLDDYIYSVAQRRDGGYIFVGTTTGLSLQFQGWIVNVDKNGAKEGEQIVGNRFKSISQTSDGGFIVAGNCPRACLYKLNQKGKEVWNRSYNLDYGFGSAVSAKETSNGYIFAINGNYPLSLVITTDLNGEEIERITFNSNSVAYSSIATDITPISGGGYALVGYNRTTDSSQPTGYKVVSWNIIVNSAGKAQTKVYEKNNAYTFITSIQQTRDGGFILGGSEGPEQKGLAIKTGPAGNQIWRRTYGDTPSNFQSVQLTSDGGFVYGGSTIINGINNFWLVKTRANGK